MPRAQACDTRHRVQMTIKHAFDPREMSYQRDPFLFEPPRSRDIRSPLLSSENIPSAELVLR